MTTVIAQSGALTFGSEIYSWAPMDAVTNNVGSAVGSPGSGDRTVQVTGTFGVGTQVAIEGSIDNANWFTLRDPSGSSLIFSSAGLKAIMENVIALRPHLIAGDGTESISVVLLTRSPRLG